MTREDFTERKVETLERLNCVAESLTSATMNHYDKMQLLHYCKQRKL